MSAARRTAPETSSPRAAPAWRAAVRLLALAGMVVAASAARGQDAAARQIVLAASERVPYVGESLPGKGYVAELVTEALRTQGWTVQFRFVPPARALLLAARGEVHGVLPVATGDAELPETLQVSSAFPGDTLGLLKKKSTALPADVDLDAGLQAVAAGLSQRGLTLGVVRRGEPDPAMSGVELASDDLQNIDKLDRDRVRLLLIDRFTAADLITGRRPQLIGKLAFVPGLAQSRPFHVAFNVKSSEGRRRLAVFDAGLRRLASDGGLERILARHGLQPAAPSATGNGEVRLTIGTVNNADMLLMRELAREYEARHPRVKLHWRVMDEGTLRTRLLSDLAIHDGQFDVVTLGSYEVPLWARRGWLVPPPTPAPAYDVADIFPSVRASLSHEGRLFALPFYAESSITYYRRDLLDAAGLRMPPQPSWDDIAHAAERLHQPSQGVYGVCLRGRPGWGENMTLVSTMVNAYGGRWFDESWRPEITSPAWQSAVSMYATLLRRWGPPDADRNGYNENLRLFSAGRCAIWVDATVAAGALYDARRSRVADKVGVVAAPRAVTARGSAWLWSWSLAVPHSSPRAAEAQAFIAWATSRGYIQSVAKRHGWVAVPPGTRRSTYASRDYRAAAPFHATVQAALANAEDDALTLNRHYVGIQYVGIPEFASIGGQVAVEVSRVLGGQVPVRDALQRAQAAAAAGMAAAGYTGKD
ncbi:sugar ABC transporter substrate-binding protein [Pelomonas sp. UHG3]|uniref:Sugar ABC transporter substrate-binding protein n=1 Tax=Roseateles hydrophilus TaxID=2975054 RepID=A0ACC6C778_9BURK|nr:sugar ABC transporter substrate-binding protein [Pelomonas sp. UHG3]MCY4744240.1 sugar ABC transporter substrate-binding protein [Pelomonas sp. UHG3]